MSTPQDKIPLRDQLDVSNVRMDGPAWDEIVRLSDNPQLPFSHNHLKAAVQYAEVMRRAAAVLMNNSGEAHPALQAAIELRLEGTGDAARDARSHLINEKDLMKPEQPRKRAVKKAAKK